jgi:regulator of protease activity HflC (stomatin/prohibitin superfamily)
MNDTRFYLTFGGIVTFVTLAVVGGVMTGCPSYNVYTAHKQGEAEFARAQQNRQIAVQEAQAHAESATYDAQAEITRAQGVAKANSIIGDSLKNNEAYLRYLFVNNLADTKDQVIYVPTEANLPILEASHRPEAPSQ